MYSRKSRKRTKGRKFIIETMLHLSGNIKWIRLLTGNTQAEFGKRIGATDAMIKSYESGKAKPDELKLRKIAKIASVEIVDLINKDLKEEKVNVINPDTKKVEFTLAPNGANQQEQELKHLKELLQEKEKQIKLLTQLVEKSSKKS